MNFLPSIEKMLREAFIDPAFKELVDSFSAQKGHINLTGMTETQKAFLIASAALYQSENEKKELFPIPVILVSDELSARRMKSYLDAFFEKESVILDGVFDHHILPLLVVWVDTIEDMHHLLEHTHREGSRATGGVEHLALVDGLQDGFALHVCKVEFFVGVLYQLAVFLFKVVADGAFQVRHKALIDHILHNLTRCVE